MPEPSTEQRSLAHWAEAGRAGMEAFYALALIPRAEHPTRIQDLRPEVGGFDVAWATHALYAVPPDEIGAGVARMVAALRPGGFGAVVHATRASHYLRFAEAFRAAFAPSSVPFTSAEEVAEALTTAGVAPQVTTLHYDVGHPDRAVVEGFLQRCVFDDTVPLERMEAEGDVGSHLAGAVDGDGYRFHQVVAVITWET